jgi:hypothetical protein
MTATLTVEQHHEYGLTGRRFVVDCLHATTDLVVIEAADRPVSDASLAILVLQAHHGREGCRCTHDLWRRYGDGDGGGGEDAA